MKKLEYEIEVLAEETYIHNSIVFEDDNTSAVNIISKGDGARTTDKTARTRDSTKNASSQLTSYAVYRKMVTDEARTVRVVTSKKEQSSTPKLFHGTSTPCYHPRKFTEKNTHLLPKEAKNKFGRTRIYSQRKRRTRRTRIYCRKRNFQNPDEALKYLPSRRERISALKPEVA
ncbi:hypothetical protein BJ508DRAFT_308882 [Ascobolus immersus RN42]|uniref:Uncharacterized protein n=1 Tax=Ascobolus immersus RN42 TaxID=1160509 RepID=A0A3N4I423_ASCIM|nr:hypothetical protein BJ508DRAFT_308882 [Ascobolus immersus RN42]